MKGVIFNILEEMVVSGHGMDCWNKILELSKPEHKGIYTAGRSYPDEELLQLVGTISEQLSIPVPDLVQAFGEHLFSSLAQRYPIFLEQPDLFSFLRSVEDVIHVEVAKLYSEPNLPEFRYRQNVADELLMEYRSPRKLCLLAEGLIRGAASHFKQPCNIGHDVCIHQGADHCEFTIQLTQAD